MYDKIITKKDSLTKKKDLRRKNSNYLHPQTINHYKHPEQKQKRYHKHRKNITIPVYICTHTENHAILLIYKIDKHRKRLYVCNIYIYTYIYICICVCVCVHLCMLCMYAMYVYIMLHTDMYR